MPDNAFGLSRNIPEEVKRIVRERCGFGCVICGKAIYQYEHFDPEFSEAKAHSPEGITLLCGSCHEEKTRGFVTNDQIAAEDADPYCKRNGSAFGQIRGSAETATLILGTNVFQNCRVFLELEHEPVIWVRRDSHSSGFKFNARIKDDTGKLILRIKDNEWTYGDGVWDVYTSGNGIFIRSRPRNFSLILRILPPDALKIEQAKIRHKGQMVNITKNGNINFDTGVSGGFLWFSNKYTAIRKSGTQQRFGAGPSRVYFLTKIMESTTSLGSPRSLQDGARDLMQVFYD